MKKKLSALLIVLALLLGLSVGALAASNLETISAYLNYGVTIKYDGVAQTMTDATGAQVYPITYNGTTYLPVRAVSGMLGLPVDWDGSTQTVYLGEKPGETQYLLDVCPPYQTSPVSYGKQYLPYTAANGDFFSMSNTTYTNGFVLKAFKDDPYAIFNLDGKYETLTFDYGHIDGTGTSNAQIQIFLDGKLCESFDCVWDALPQGAAITVSGALQMKIVLKADGTTFSNTPIYGLGNMVIK